ncbi:MAG: (Fe-S)-binding protein [Chloroflexi bacterium]|nr:(Fe-S)-binding protein [Chloroflexota bacterium]
MNNASPGLRSRLDVPREVVKRCVHCGLCLDFCPTYRLLGNELDSPRGRIYQMRALSEGRIQADDPNFRLHIFRCLDCRACETACPSGVDYGRMVEAARAEIRAANRAERLTRDVLLDGVFTSNLALDALGTATRAYQRSGAQRLLRGSGLLRILPGPLKKLGDMEAMLPDLPGGVRPAALPPRTLPPRGEVRHRVAFITGCIAARFFDATNAATVRVLARNGCEVFVPPPQKCCGALHVHAGERDTARQLARHNIATFERSGADVYLVNAAGCGSTLKEYGELLEDDSIWSRRAHAFAERVRDITEFLASIDLETPRGTIERTVTYQDACHLAHGQGIREQPRRLLRLIPGLRLVEMRESDFCCGSAGIYNITQPEMAGRLLDLKMESIIATGADAVVAANPGCIIQIAAGIRQRGLPMEAIHPVDLLGEAYRRGDAMAPPGA